MRSRMRLIGSVVASALILGLVLAAGAPPAVGTADILVAPINAQSANAAAIGSCSGWDYVSNGNFEGGFTSNGVGAGWQSFTNGGDAGYGFYDDQWPPVVYDGSNSQLIEINTKNNVVGSPDRYAGIFQYIKGPSADPTYEFALAGLIRERDLAQHQGDDAFRYRVQWGWASGFTSDWTAVSNWKEIPWNRIDDRLSPGPFQTYSTQFQAPAGNLTLFVRAWKKWGNPYREADFNLDSISLRTCPNSPAPTPTPPTNNDCFVNYVVQPGDTLSGIAAKYGATVDLVLRYNNIPNVGLIYAGMVIVVPNVNKCGNFAGSTLPWKPAPKPKAPPPPPPPPPASASASASATAKGNANASAYAAAGPGYAIASASASAAGNGLASANASASSSAGNKTTFSRTYTVRKGDTLSGIAAKFGVNVNALAALNGISNSNKIYVGMVLKIP